MREDEKIRVAVSSMRLLQTNDSYIPNQKKEDNEENKREIAESPEQARSSVPRAPRLFLRVPDIESRNFLKSVNLVDIFEGNTPVIFYREDEKSYFTYNRGITLSETVLSEFKSLLGHDNVILK